MELHQLNLAEAEKSVTDYATFNEFFSRRLKVMCLKGISSFDSDPYDPNRLVLVRFINPPTQQLQSALPTAE